MKNFNITVNGTTYQVEVEEVKVPSPATKAAPTPVATPKITGAVAAAATAPVEVGADDTVIKAPMPGKILKVVVTAGQTVKKGDIMMILEAMKMQNEMVAPVDGIIKSINVAADRSVKTNDILAVIK